MDISSKLGVPGFHGMQYPSRLRTLGLVALVIRWVVVDRSSTVAGLAYDAYAQQVCRIGENEARWVASCPH